MRGFGRVFKRGSIYWIAYFHQGKEYRESSRSESQKEARDLLKKRIGDIGAQPQLGDRCTVSNAHYDDDLFAWAMEQARMLRARDYHCVDAENVAEELEAMARKERRELESRLHTLLFHLLKWFTRPRDRKRLGPGWKITMREQRRQIADLLEDSPSLRSYLDNLLTKAWKRAVEDASDELPKQLIYGSDYSPWRFEELMDQHFLPEVDHPSGI